MTLSRRSFIKITGAGATAAALGSGLLSNLWGLDPNHIHDPHTDGDRVVPTFCEICFWKCGVLAHVKDNRVTKITGNPAHPLSRGRLCPRGTGGTGLLYDPDRLKKPLLRKHARGREVFEEVSWERALDEVAGRMAEIQRKHGPDAVALWSHGYGGSWFQKLIKAYGSHNITAPSYAQCRGARETGFELTYGSPVGSPESVDMAHSRAIAFIGSHLGENMHNTQVQDLARAIESGADLIVVDPRFSTVAGKARHWLPIKPGTDIALLLAWMHVIIGEKLYDREYLDRHAVGLDKLAAHVADKTPEWAAVHTGLDAAKITETARILAGARPAALVHPGRRTAWYGDDTQRSRAIAIVNALLGSWGRRGGFFLPAALSVPAYAKGPKAANPPHGQHPDARPDVPVGTVYPFLGEKRLAHGIRDASIPGHSMPYDIKGWLVYGTNILQSVPEPEKTVAALKALDFVVAIDVLPAEITGWADVVLPEATYLERYDDLHAPPWRQGFVSLRQPAVAPMYDSKPGWWIAKEIATRLGVGHAFDFDDVEDYLDARLQKIGTDLSTLARSGVASGAAEPIYIEDGIEPTFATPSGKIELYCSDLDAAGLPPLPPYTPPEEPPADHFRLLFGRAPTHTFGRTTNNRFLSQVYDENRVWVNAARARELDLADGQEVMLVNQDGVEAGPVKVRATQRIRPDAVYMVHGYGHTSKGLRFARGRGASDSVLCTRPRIDPAMGGTGMNTNFVRIEKVIS